VAKQVNRGTTEEVVAYENSIEFYSGVLMSKTKTQQASSLIYLSRLNSPGIRVASLSRRGIKGIHIIYESLTTVENWVTARSFWLLGCRNVIGPVKSVIMTLSLSIVRPKGRQINFIR
jgi:hypothetical protein